MLCMRASGKAAVCRVSGARLPVALEGAEVADLHAAGPALLGGGAAADLAQDNQLRARLAVQAQALKLIQQHVLPSLCLRAPKRGR